MTQWWKEAVIYQIYPRSFCDSNGDGIGDLPGITQHLDDLQRLGVDAIWLSPIYPSPNEDNGYDISDYCAIHPDFGTMEDFDQLVAQARQRGIRIILDLVMNHTSTRHPWFQAARDKNSPYRDYYYWQPAPAPGKLPNNWTSFFGGTVWEYDEKSCEYYLHLFAPHQPDLNYHNPAVLEEMKKVLRFWLDRGVAGFRCDAINYLYKDSLASSRKKTFPVGAEHYNGLDGTHVVLRELRKILDEYGAFTVGETAMAGPEEARKFCDPERGELDAVFSFEHMLCDRHGTKWRSAPFRWSRFMLTLAKWQEELPWNALYLENHDQPRSVSRFGSDRYPMRSARLLATLLLTLRGTPFIYQGQEIGMTNFDYTSMKDIRDVESLRMEEIMKKRGIPKGIRWRAIARSSRDNSRTPMQWSDAPQAGFTDGTPWIAVNGNYKKINVAAQEKETYSVLDYYRRLIALRRGCQTLLHGDFQLLGTDETLSAYSRTLGDETLVVVLNHSDRPVCTDAVGQLVLSSYGYTRFDGMLQPWEAVILRAAGGGQS